MASSSRPFQSQTFTQFLATYRTLAQGAAQRLRQGRTALLWGVQVALYPAYLGFQSLRRLARQLPMTQLRSRMTALFTDPPSASPRLVGDAPIRALLSVTQPQRVRQPGGLRYVDCYGELLRQSRAESVLTNGQWQWLPLQTPVQGIASDVATRQLVLVTGDQQIFSSLTADQQDRLHRAIVLLLAEYARLERRQGLEQPAQPPGLPLPQARPNQWLPVRWVNHLMGWMQTSPLAIATNLFGEAQILPRTPLGTGAELRPTPSHRQRELGSYGVQTAVQADGQIPTVGLLGPTQSPSMAKHLGAPILVETIISGTGVAQLQLPVEAERPLFRPPVSQPSTNPEPVVWSGQDALETQAALVHYVDHPLVVVLRWLDGTMYTLESWLRSLWKWLLRHL